MSGKRVQESIVIHAACSQVWRTLTEPALMKQWLSDDEVNITSDFKEGSVITSAGELNGKPYESKGIILKFEPERIFSYSYWTSLSEIPDHPANYSVFEFSLACHENETTLTFTGRHFSTEAIYAHHRFYWKITLGILKSVAETSAMRY